MNILYFMVTILGAILTATATVLKLYVSQYYAASGKVQTIVQIMRTAPWSLKFIYGLLIDKYITSKSYKLKLLMFLPVSMVILNFIPAIMPLSIAQFYIISLLISIPNAFFQNLFNSYLYQEISDKVYNPDVLGHTLSYIYLGRIFSNLAFLFLSGYFHDDLEKVIFYCYLLTSFLGILLMLCTYYALTGFEELHRGSLYHGLSKEVANSLELENNNFKKLNSEEDKNLFLKIKLLFKNRKYQKMILYLIILGLVPTYAGYYSMMLMAPSEMGGIGAGASMVMITQIVFYIGGYLGPKIFIFYKNWRAKKLYEEEIENPGRTVKRELSFIALFLCTLINLLKESLFYFPVENYKFYKICLYTLFGFLAANVTGLNGGLMNLIFGENCPSGLEGTVFSLWTSLENFGGAYSLFIGIWVIKWCNWWLGYNNDGSYFVLKPAYFIAFVTHICILPIVYLIE